MSETLPAIFLTLKLAVVTTILLLIVGIPLAWWLSQSKHKFRVFIEALISLPIVLPPTVLGFYLLVFMGEQGPLGRILDSLGFGPVVFSFSGLVIGSFFYSMPFVIHPLKNGFKKIDSHLLDAAATVGANKWTQFLTIALPLTKAHLLTAAVLGVAHTIGEFGVVLMIGGNIPGKTKVLSIEIYDLVEGLQYQQAGLLSLALVIFSFITLLILHSLDRENSRFYSHKNV